MKITRKKYQLIAVLDATLTSNERSDKENLILSTLKENNAIVLSNTSFEKRFESRFGNNFRINTGFYLVYEFETENNSIKPIQERLNITDGILLSRIFAIPKSGYGKGNFEEINSSFNSFIESVKEKRAQAIANRKEEKEKERERN